MMDHALDLSSEQRWRLVSLGSAVLASVLVRGAIKAGWRLSRDDEPPLDPLSRQGDWRGALLFSVATGVTVGLARLAARTVATATWERDGLHALRRGG